MNPIDKSQISYLSKIERRALYFSKGLKAESLDADYQEVVGILSEATVKCERKYMEDDFHEASLETYISKGQRNAMNRYRERLHRQKFQFESPSVAQDETFFICMMKEMYSSGNAVERGVWLQILKPCGAVQKLMSEMDTDRRYSKHIRAIAEYCDLPARKVAQISEKIKQILEGEWLQE